MDLTKTYQKKIGISLKKLTEKVSLILTDRKCKSVIIHRLKKDSSILSKMKRQALLDIFQITDIYGIKILTSSRGNIFLIFHALKNFLDLRVKHDYVSSPKTNILVPGKSLKTLICIGVISGVSFELQITTKSWNRENEKLHAGYKSRQRA